MASAVRELVPQSEAEPLRPALYVRISAEHRQHTASNQKSALLCYTEARELHIALIYSDEAKAKSESRDQS
jgi:DNA invertase Pin-like site-specific DNA recombinase